MFAFERYAELKAKDRITIQKVGPNAIAIVRKFDQGTGAEIAPDMGPIDVARLQDALSQSKALTAGLEALLADLKELGVAVV